MILGRPNLSILRIKINLEIPMDCIIAFIGTSQTQLLEVCLILKQAEAMVQVNILVHKQQKQVHSKVENLQLRRRKRRSQMDQQLATISAWVDQK